MKLLMLMIVAAGLAAAQTTTTYDITSGTHNCITAYSEAQAIACNSLNGITVYDAAGDRAALGQPVPQFDPGPNTQEQPVYCIDVVSWTNADAPQVGVNGQVWTFAAPNSSGQTALSATIYTTWTIVQGIVGGKGGSRRTYTKIYTVVPQAIANSNFQVTE